MLEVGVSKRYAVLKAVTGRAYFSMHTIIESYCFFGNFPPIVTSHRKNPEYVRRPFNITICFENTIFRAFSSRRPEDVFSAMSPSSPRIRAETVSWISE